MLVKVNRYSFRNGNIRWQISNSLKVRQFIIALALSVSEILTFYDFQKSMWRSRVKFSQLHHSMAIVKICKCLPYIFALAVTVSDLKIFNFFFKLQNKNCWPSKSSSRSRNTIFTLIYLAGKCPLLQKTPLYLTLSVALKSLIFFLKKVDIY